MADQRDIFVRLVVDQIGDVGGMHAVTEWAILHRTAMPAQIGRQPAPVPMLVRCREHALPHAAMRAQPVQEHQQTFAVAALRHAEPAP